MRVDLDFLVYIAANDGCLRYISVNGGIEEFLNTLVRREPAVDWKQDEEIPVLQETAVQLKEYFAGGRQTFDVPIELQGTGFQKRVWEALLTIPYGETRSYREIAAQIDAPGAVRAVGAANGRNPLPIVVPCHRVIAADGSLAGYAAGLPVKRMLLQLEGSLSRLGYWNPGC